MPTEREVEAVFVAGNQAAGYHDRAEHHMWNRAIIRAALTAAERVRGAGPVLDREVVESALRKVFADGWKYHLADGFGNGDFNRAIDEATDAIMAMVTRPVLDREAVSEAVRQAYLDGQQAGLHGTCTVDVDRLKQRTDAIMSSAKSEADVRRGERERLAQAAQGAIVVEDDFGMPMLSALPDWLRSQGGAS